MLTWADALLQANPGRRGIVVSHHIVNTGNPASFGTQGQAIYDALKANPNLFLMLSGHVCNGSPPNIQPEGLRQDTFDGRTVYSMLSDYQCDSAGGNGWLRILTFRPQQNEIQVETYSPWLDQYRTGSLSQFAVPYDMGGAGVCGAANTAFCDDADACTVTDMCSAGSCAPGTPIESCANGDGCCPPGCEGSDDDCLAPEPIPMLGARGVLGLVAALALGAGAASRARAD